MTSIPVILNPAAGGGRLLRGRKRLDAAAEAAGVTLEWWLTREPGHATELASRAAREDRPLVLAYGGDGTYNEVARGLLGSATPMGVLPGGTTSVLAYEFGVPRPAARAVTALIAGEDRAMRVACSDRGDLILLMVSAGPDSQVLSSLRPSLKRLGGRVGIAMQAVLEAFGRGPLPRFRVVIGCRSEESGWAVIGNSRCYAGPQQVTPGADPFRDDLEVVLQRSVGRWAALSFLVGIPRGGHLQREDVRCETVTRVRLEPVSPGRDIPYQVDGDVVGCLPVEISVDERPLWVRLPG
ncbi:MAG: diacylglycerol kinase family protein [Thermoanaerobaculales bacterium]